MSGAMVDIVEVMSGATCGTSRLPRVTDVVDGLLLRAVADGDDELKIGETDETGRLTWDEIDVGAISMSVVWATNCSISSSVSIGVAFTSLSMAPLELIMTQIRTVLTGLLHSTDWRPRRWMRSSANGKI